MQAAPSAISSDLRAPVLIAAKTRVTLTEIAGTNHRKFQAMMEFMRNATFRTVDVDLVFHDYTQFFERGGRIYCMDVDNAFTDHGLAGVMMMAGLTIEQIALSCAVLGLDVETALFATVLPSLRGYLDDPIIGLLKPRQLERLSQSVFENCGFVRSDDPTVWVLHSHNVIRKPQHITVRWTR